MRSAPGCSGARHGTGRGRAPHGASRMGASADLGAAANQTLAGAHDFSFVPQWCDMVPHSTEVADQSTKSFSAEGTIAHPVDPSRFCFERVALVEFALAQRRLLPNP